MNDINRLADCIELAMALRHNQIEAAEMTRQILEHLLDIAGIERNQPLPPNPQSIGKPVLVRIK